MFDLMDSIQKVCLVYQSMGLGFVTRDSSPRKIRLATTWFLLQMAIIVTNVALMLKFHRLIYYYHDAMGAFNDLIKYIATVCATILIIVESYRKRHKLAQIEELAGAFQQEMVVFLRRKELVKSNRKFWHNYKIKFFAFTIYYVLSEAILIPVYLLSRNYSKSIAYVFSNNVMIGICRYRHLQHVLYMDLVDYELRLLVHILRSGKVSEQKLGRLQELYGNTGQKVKLLNNFFSSQSMNIIFNHLQLLGDFYWIYWRHLNGCCSVGFYRILVTMSHTTWLMYLIFSTSVSCSNTVIHISHWLHKLPRNGINSAKIVNFSLEIMYKGIKFWACGLFSIDYGALIQIVLSILKFVVMFTQFASNNNAQGQYLASDGG